MPLSKFEKSYGQGLNFSSQSPNWHFLELALPPTGTCPSGTFLQFFVSELNFSNFGIVFIRMYQTIKKILLKTFTEKKRDGAISRTSRKSMTLRYSRICWKILFHLFFNICGSQIKFSIINFKTFVKLLKLIGFLLAMIRKKIIKIFIGFIVKNKIRTYAAYLFQRLSHGIISK